MPNVSVKVKNKIATGDNTQVICDNSDYVVNFTFDSEWDSIESKIMRILFTSGNYYDVPFEGVSVNLPILSNVTSFKLGVYGGNLHTSTPASFKAKASILNGHGEEIMTESYFYGELLNERWGTSND